MIKLSTIVYGLQFKVEKIVAVDSFSFRHSTFELGSQSEAIL